jgi:hypothetical protein
VPEVEYWSVIALGYKLLDWVHQKATYSVAPLFFSKKYTLFSDTARHLYQLHSFLGFHSG